LVERAGWRGFMLVDVGGYYNIQIRKWLDGIQWSLSSEQWAASSEQYSHIPVALWAAWDPDKNTHRNNHPLPQRGCPRGDAGAARWY
jgi:hypothetical protein